MINEGNTNVIHTSDAMQKMETIAQRLKRLRTEKGLSQGDLAKAAGLKSQGTIGNIEREMRGYGESVVDIAKALGVSPDYLRCITDIPHKTTAPTNVEPGPDTRGKVPLISWVQAGAWCHASEPLAAYDVERWMHCPRAHSDETFALRVRGDSMVAAHGKTYPEGCFIFVDGAQKSPTNGALVIACLVNSNDTTFKVYKNEDGRQWLMPLNPQHPAIHEPFHVLGTVIGKWEDA